MKHVGEGFSVHQSMLDCDIQQLSERALAVFRQRCGLDRPVQSLAGAFPIRIHLPNTRPVLGPVRRQTSANGSMPNAKRRSNSQ